MAEWIRIEDGLPEDGEIVDIYHDSHGRLCNYEYVKAYNGDKSNNFFDPVEGGICCVRDATHWMPLPQSPKGENK